MPLSSGPCRISYEIGFKNLAVLMLALPSIVTPPILTSANPLLSRPSSDYDGALYSNDKVSSNRFEDSQFPFFATPMTADKFSSDKGEKIPTVEGFLALLNPKAKGYGIPCSNRTHWDKIVKDQKLFTKDTVSSAVLGSTPFPAWNNTAYLAFARTGDPLPGRTMIPSRMNALGNLALAECVFWNGSFVDRLNQALLSVAMQPSWETPENDPQLFLFNGKGQHFDLYAGPTVGILAQIVYLLDTKIQPTVTAAIKSEAEKRIFAPSRRFFLANTGKVPDTWTFENIFISESNRNPLTFSGVLVAALGLISDLKDRALIVRGICIYVQRYLLTIWDGYPEEGLGYYGLGFGSYLEVRELVLDATNGAVDMLNFEEAAYAAFYPPGLNRYLLGYTRNAFDLEGVREFGPMTIATYFNTASIGYYLNSVPPRPPSDKLKTLANRIRNDRTYVRYEQDYRTVFFTPGVFVGRPGPLGKATSNLYFAFNTCGNGASHDHAAVGSYVISVNGRNIMGDPGGPAFYGAAFYQDRYLSMFTNAAGHPVPVVGGYLQERGMKVCQSYGDRYPQLLLETANFTPLFDSFAIDMSLAYPNAWNMVGMRTLTRTATYDRRGNGKLIILDRVVFDQNVGTVSSKTYRSVTTGNKLSLFNQTSSTTGIMYIPGEPWKVLVTAYSPTHKNLVIEVEKVVDIDTKESWPKISVVLTKVTTAQIGFVFEPVL
ncbi:hypothetical protein HDU97_009490 [Phlyctochytrium planicorne]|nr:hypothetical protein HDU97_009490 [Phlyctochytrium planicorne]